MQNCTHFKNQPRVILTDTDFLVFLNAFKKRGMSKSFPNETSAKWNIYTKFKKPFLIGNKKLRLDLEKKLEYSNQHGQKK